MIPPTIQTDRNFDDLATRFARNIYGSAKGEVRLAMLGHELVLSDLSKKMVEETLSFSKKSYLKRRSSCFTSPFKN